MLELTGAEVEELLRAQVVGRVGCHANGVTYVVPVIYAWDGESVYVQSIEGRKIAFMRENPEVCFEVDEYNPDGSWRSVIIQGRYEELTGVAAARALALLVKRFARPGGSRPPRRDRGQGRTPVAFRIRAAEISGRASGPR